MQDDIFEKSMYMYVLRVLNASSWTNILDL